MTSLLCFVAAAAAIGSDGAAPKIEGLRALNEYVGTWNGVGGPDRPRPDPKDPVWKETIEWCWRFQGGDAWLSLSVKDGKHVSAGEVRYRPEKKDYVLRLIDEKSRAAEFTGKLDKGYLVFERLDPANGETQQVAMNTAGDGVRFVYRYATKPKGRTVFARIYQVAASKAGESLGVGGKKNECIVTGGLGTIPVSYMGETYWVCCTGCRDAFNEEPAKYVRAHKEKKSKN